MTKSTHHYLVCVTFSVLVLLGLGAIAYAVDSGASPKVQSIMLPYIQIHDALAQDSLDGVPAAAAKLGAAAQSDQVFPNELVQEAQTLAQAKDLVAARAAFKPLSETLIKVLVDNNLKPDAYVEAYCPMVGAHWLQTGTTISNPFGAAMSHCGSLVKGDGSPAASSAAPACPTTGGCCN